MAFGRLFGPTWPKMELSGAAGLAFGPCLAVFREGRPFSEKVASGAAQGGDSGDFGAVLAPISVPFWQLWASNFACDFGIPKKRGSRNFFSVVPELLAGPAECAGPAGD